MTVLQTQLLVRIKNNEIPIISRKIEGEIGNLLCIYIKEMSILNDKNTYENITDVSLLQNTYNKNAGSEITKPFIDKDSSTLTQSNSIP